MTGEITLQGAVLPIGGVKQKVLAAHRAGLREVVLPKRNAADLDDVPEAVRDEMTFHLANTYPTCSPPPSPPDHASSGGETSPVTVGCGRGDQPGRDDTYSSLPPSRRGRRAHPHRGGRRRAWPHRRPRPTPTPATRGGARCAAA